MFKPIALFIAWRYFFAKKSKQIIHIISLISCIGIFLSTMAMVIVSSGFNGIEKLVENTFNRFSYDLKISSANGQPLFLSPQKKEQFLNIVNIKHSTGIIEQTFILKYDGQWIPVKMMGVDSNYAVGFDVKSNLIDGEWSLIQDPLYHVVINQSLQYKLGRKIMTHEPFIANFYGIKQQANLQSKADFFANMNSKYFLIEGVVAINSKEDVFRAWGDLSALQTLLAYKKHQIDYIGIQTEKNADLNALKKRIKNLFPHPISIQTKYQQHELIFQTNEIEKWIVMFILVFILLLSVFNMTASMSMCMLDKKHSIFILKSLGLVNVNNVFFLNGMIIGLIGCVGGLIIGVGFVLAQSYFGFIGFNFGESWPVELHLEDLGLICLVVLVLSAIGSYLPVRFFRR